MNILLCGSGPALAWIHAFFEEASATGKWGENWVITAIAGPISRELYASLLGGVIDALILADHSPFVDGLPSHEISEREAVRREAQRAVLALELARRAARTVILPRSNAENWPSSLAGLLAELQTAPLREWPLGPRIPALPMSREKVSASSLVSGYLEPLFATVGRRTPSLILKWPRECFLDGDAPGHTLPATVEVAGRARILAYGPYLPLPTGRWCATAFLGFSPDIGKVPFILEADTGGAVARGFFEVECGGIFSLGLDFQVTDAMHSVELRLISQDSVLEGQLALIEVTLEYIAPNRNSATFD